MKFDKDDPIAAKLIELGKIMFDHYQRQDKTFGGTPDPRWVDEKRGNKGYWDAIFHPNNYIHTNFSNALKEATTQAFRIGFQPSFNDKWYWLVAQDIQAEIGRSGGFVEFTIQEGLLLSTGLEYLLALDSSDIVHRFCLSCFGKPQVMRKLTQKLDEAEGEKFAERRHYFAAKIERLTERWTTSDNKDEKLSFVFRLAVESDQRICRLHDNLFDPGTPTPTPDPVPTGDSSPKSSVNGATDEAPPTISELNPS